MTIKVLLLKPDSQDPSPVDQSLGARLASAHAAECSGVAVEEAAFRHGDLADLEKVLSRYRGKVSAVLGATSVPESARLGELAEAMGLLCFVANNNPVVWQRRSQVFHIGLPSSQTATAVAGHLQRRGCRRIALIHDQTDFQRRVAANMERAIQAHGAAARCYQELTDATLAALSLDGADLVYVVYSSEAKALPVARRVRSRGMTAPLLFGRSLMRPSFLSNLGANAGEMWFVDMFSRVAPDGAAVPRFFETLGQAGIAVPTANHAFGWDGMVFCSGAMVAAQGDPAKAIAYLESGVQLNGVTGACSFSAENHNGRTGAGPTVITRWHDGRFEDV
ncbi:MAG: amino acid ABC transporter substrate-binding protein [Deltaproteobacteria bacterium]|nr:amino acid ABC transporter substrate-binding protein [Deltaproteobacteria bacterium]